MGIRAATRATNWDAPHFNDPLGASRAAVRGEKKESRAITVNYGICPEEDEEECKCSWREWGRDLNGEDHRDN